MSDKEGNAAEIGQDSRKRKRTARRSQTDDELSTSGETNPTMAATLTAEINRQLDLCSSWNKGNQRAQGKTVHIGERKLRFERKLRVRS